MVNLKYWGQKSSNLGDYLAPIIVEWILNNRKIQDRSIQNINLLTVGSILAADFFHDNAVVWGTGIHYIEDAGRLAYAVENRVLDIRAVRGPITRRALEQAGYPCPHVYGDPAILMPLVYQKKERKIKGKVSVIRHSLDADLDVPANINKIDVRTNNYREFIDEITSSERIISSSLHGIILGESYHIPSVFLLEHETAEFIKYFDWYYSTGRSNIKIAHSIDEAMNIVPMELPNLELMRNKLLDVFPIDIYNSNFFYKEKKVVLFGMGDYCKRIIHKIKETAQVNYICDNDSSKWGKDFEGVLCISPDQLYKMKDIYVVITTEREKNVKDIKKQLCKSKILFYETATQWLRHVNYGNFQKNY